MLKKQQQKLLWLQGMGKRDGNRSPGRRGSVRARTGVGWGWGGCSGGFAGSMCCEELVRENGERCAERN